MNDVLATLLALGLLYLVVKFAFGGPPSPSSSANNREPIPAHEQLGHLPPQQRATAAASSSWVTSSSSSKKETLISRYGLEGRLGSSISAASPSVPLSYGIGPEAVRSKGKGKVQNDEEWKKGAAERREELKRRKEDMILNARRRLLEQQNSRRSRMEDSSSSPSIT